MRVPNKCEKKMKFISALFFSIPVIFIFSILIACAVSPTAGASNGRLSIILIDGDEIYVRSGDYYSLLQDYQLHVKGANSEGNRVWIELCRDDTSIEDAIVGEGDTFIYSNNSTEILNLTVEKIYGGADGVLVKFSPVYQYLNPRLPMPQAPVTTPDNNSNNNSSPPPVFENQAKGFDMPILLLSMGAVLLVSGIFAGIYKKK
ncbi:Hypothetical protein MmTuc01_1909 [Methanosarcina mazei Tuc01]|uniref:S-layer family duplication domain-containing protein n=1 Tax=Methanosarcina mazei Tuc01 TaxID=1236903 RepID=M1QAI6_METMZ|nr:Hypothetical protein MmTuc01_1909 [Methanosarcina mazei Tuc01]